MLQVSAVIRGAKGHVSAPFQLAIQELVDTCKIHLSSVDEEMVRRAFRLSYWAHRNDRRQTGEPYIIHPLAVAMIVAQDIRCDDTSVAAALLHDVVEDTELTLDLIRGEFGETMAMLIDGLTKIRGVFATRAVGEAENVRKLMLSMAQDVRVILVKFADRLHNMRTIDSVQWPKQLKVAQETVTLFAPLAHRFGLQAIKNELEDLSLRVLETDAFYKIVGKLNASKRERSAYIASFIQPIKDQLQSSGLDVNVYGRPKNVYSIYRKMKTQNKPFEEIYDLFAIRVVLKTGGRQGKEDCWRVYSIITDLYRPLPERFRDFISVPKSNGYQSLHTTVLDPEGRRIEVQIRTREMHEIAERGVAAHWKYKENVSKSEEAMDRFLSWVRDLMDNPGADQATEFVKDFSLNLYTDEIYVFTPRGDLKTLPTDATPVDFAFQIHTDIGMQCIGAKVNGKMVPLSHRLRSGDQVEIITSRKQKPNPDWIKFVVTHKARSRIRHWVNEERRETVNYGRKLWERKAKKARIRISESDLARCASRFKYQSPKQMFFEIASGLFDVNDLVHLIRTGETQDETEKESRTTEFEEFTEQARNSGQETLLINGEHVAGLAIKFAACCNPIPGDSVFGYASRTGVIKIHRTGCRNASHLLVNHADRIQACDWSRQKNVQFVAGLRVVGEDRVGILYELTTVISRNLKTNIRSITVDTKDGIFEGTIILYVSDLAHLRRLMDRLRKLDHMHGVYRFEE